MKIVFAKMGSWQEVSDQLSQSLRRVLTATKDVKEEIHNRFETLSYEEQNKLTDAIQQWTDSTSAEKRLAEAVEKVKDYMGSPGDEDVHGEVDATKASLDDYLDAQNCRAMCASRSLQCVSLLHTKKHLLRRNRIVCWTTKKLTANHASLRHLRCCCDLVLVTELLRLASKALWCPKYFN